MTMLVRDGVEFNGAEAKPGDFSETRGYWKKVAETFPELFSRRPWWFSRIERKDIDLLSAAVIGEEAFSRKVRREAKKRKIIWMLYSNWLVSGIVLVFYFIWTLVELPFFIASLLFGEGRRYWKKR